jgi:hypothetical protein
MYGLWLYQDIVYVWLVVKLRNCLYMGNGYSWTLCMNSGYIRHCLYMDSGYMRTLFMHGQWLYQDIIYAWTVVI